MLGSRLPRVQTVKGRSRNAPRRLELLERRTLLNAAPVAIPDEFEVRSDHVLSVSEELPPELVLVHQSPDGHIYGAVVGGGTWAAARDAAAQLSYRGAAGHLVTFNSSAEHAFVRDNLAVRLANEFGAGDIWIGLSDIQTEGTFRWVTGEPLTFTAWGGGEPNNAGDEDVVEMYANGLWNDSNAGEGSAAYIVEFDPPFQTGVLANDTDADGDALTATLVADVEHGTLELAADGSFTYTPDPGFVGVDTFTYRASDGQATSNVAEVTISVLPNQAPIAQDDQFEVLQDHVLSLGNQLPEGVEPVIWGVNGHAYLQVSQSVNWDEAVAGSSSWVYEGVTGHLVTFTSKAESDFVRSQVLTGASSRWIGLTDEASEGSFQWVTGEPLTYSSWNGGEPNNSGGNEDYVEMYPGGGWNDLPGNAVLAGYLVEFDAPFVGGVLKNDTDADGDTLQAKVVTLPEYGELAFASNGTFVYTPDPGFVGVDTFTYHALDGAATSNVATATINVLRFNSAPVAAHDVYATPVNEPRNISAARGVLVNDVDPQHDDITATLLVQPKFGSVTLAADGSFNYMPATDFVGIDWFTYEAADHALTSRPATVTIQVTPTNDTPVARDEAYTLDEDGEFTVGTDPQTVVRQISQQSRALVFDASGNRLFVSAGNDLVPIDVFTGQVLAPVTIGQQPGRIVISDDGRFIYAAVNQDRNVKRFDTTSGAVDVSWQIGDFTEYSTAIGDMEPVPGEPNRVAIQQYYTCCSPRSGGVMIFDDGVLLPKHTSGGLGTSGGGDSIAFADPGLLIGYTNTISSFGIWQMRVDDEGLTVLMQREWLLCCFNQTITAGGGQVYHSNGTVLRASDFRILGAMPVGGGYFPDPNYNRVLALSQEGSTVRITSVDPETLQVSDVVTVPNIAGGVGDLVVMGPGDFAFRTTEGKVVLVHDDALAGQPGRGVMSNDFDPEGDPLTATLVETAQHGDLVIHADGTFSYMPDENFFGEDSFTYQASDGTHVSNIATVRLTVRGSNDAPVAEADEYEMPIRQPLVIPAASGVLRNDTDADGQQLTAALLTAPTKGTVQLAANGGFTYTPGASFVDGDSFVYRAFDGQTYSEPVTVEIIYDVPRITVGAHTLLPNTPNQTIQVFVSGGHAVSGLNLYAQVGDGGPERVQFDLPAGKDGPAITGIDIKTGTMFAGVPDSAQVDLAIPQVASALIAIAQPGATVEAEGLLATITVDTTGFFGGRWDLLLNNVLAGFVDGPFHTDFAGQPAIVDIGQLIIEEATITRREIMYAGSVFGDAPATDKQALLPGQTATFANYSSYVGGINAIAVEIANALGTPSLADFAFYVGNSNDTSTWQLAPAPTFQLLAGAGIDGADRIVLRWADGAIKNKWLMVRIKSTINTGLAADDVFYFGNAVGESGDNPSNAIVNATDVIGTRDNPHGPFNLAAIDDRFDFNRDRLVNATDLVIARDHITSPLTALRLIAPTGAVPTAPLRRLAPRLSAADRPGWTMSFAVRESQARVAALDALFANQDFAASDKRRAMGRRGYLF